MCVCITLHSLACTEESTRHSLLLQEPPLSILWEPPSLLLCPENIKQFVQSFIARSQEPPPTVLIVSSFYCLSQSCAYKFSLPPLPLPSCHVCFCLWSGGWLLGHKIFSVIQKQAKKVSKQVHTCAHISWDSSNWESRLFFTVTGHELSQVQWHAWLSMWKTHTAFSQLESTQVNFLERSSYGGRESSWETLRQVGAVCVSSVSWTMCPGPKIWPDRARQLNHPYSIHVHVFTKPWG